MTRRRRKSILYDGCYSHIFSRSIEKRFIFGNDQEFNVFKGLLLAAKKEYGFHIFHYCLMHTHFHLAIRIEKLKHFSEGMKWLKWQYTVFYNKARKRRGTVWQGRFNSMLIEDERYLRACGAYIEHNPVEAGLVKQATDWPYSSSRFYNSEQKDELIDTYPWDGALPVIEEDRTRFFEKGSAIGSPLFQLHINEDILESMSAP